MTENLEVKSDGSASRMRLNSGEFREAMGSKTLLIIVFGASGHLAKTKTFPALFDLYQENVFPGNTHFVGAARSAKSNEEFREAIGGSLKAKYEKKGQPLEDEILNGFLNAMSYIKLDGYDQPFTNLGEDLNARANGPSNRLFYFALPPSVYESVARGTKEFCLTDSGFNRVIIEKPFGKDTDSCTELLESIAASIPESDVYRIDHYLAKELVQNVLTLRFGNTLWDYIWHRQAIKCVKISFKEDAGVDGRGGYYDEFGAIRDIFQNHLMQVLTLVAMEAPVTLDANDIRDEKVKVLKAISPPKLDSQLSQGELPQVLVGQYSAGNGKPGYRDDPSVADDSKQVTFLQTVLFINNSRWQGVPFICKCGKALDERRAEVRIQFKQEGLHLFPNVAPNELVIRLQPDEAMYLKINTKVPGFAHFNEATMTELNISYNERFADLQMPEAYARLIADALRGDQALFVRQDELLQSWRITTPILKEVEETHNQPLVMYERGGRGPDQADDMAHAYGFSRNENYVWPVQAVPETKL